MLFQTALVTFFFNVRFSSVWVVRQKRPMFIKLKKKKKVQVWGNARWSGDADFFYVLLTGAGSFHEVWRRSWDVKVIQFFFFFRTALQPVTFFCLWSFFSLFYAATLSSLFRLAEQEIKWDGWGWGGCVLVILARSDVLFCFYPAVLFRSCLGIVSFA